MHLARITCLTLFAFGCAAPNAATILSNYPIQATGSAGAFSSTSWEAVGFRLGQGASYVLDSVTMRLSATTPGLVSVGLYDSVVRSSPCGWSAELGTTYCDDVAPGSRMVTTASQMVDGIADYTFAANGAQPLAAGAVYWVVFRGETDGQFQYYEQQFDGSAFPYTSETGATVHDFASTPGMVFDPATGGSTPGVLGVDWTLHSGLNAIEIRGSVSPVPEPDGAWLLLIGLPALVASRRRRGAA